MEAFAFGAIIGSLLVGGITGAVPAICGAVKGKIGLGIGGFFACLAAGLLLGLILAIPMCALFVFLIFKKDKKAQAAHGDSAEQGENTQSGEEQL